MDNPQLFALLTWCWPGTCRCIAPPGCWPAVRVTDIVWSLGCSAGCDLHGYEMPVIAIARHILTIQPVPPATQSKRSPFVPQLRQYWLDGRSVQLGAAWEDIQKCEPTMCCLSGFPICPEVICATLCPTTHLQSRSRLSQTCRRRGSGPRLCSRSSKAQGALQCS